MDLRRTKPSWLIGAGLLSLADVPLAAPGDTQLEQTRAVQGLCANYARAMTAALYPRDAVDRGLKTGNATVVFVIDGTRIRDMTITSSSDPVFGAAAVSVVSQLECKGGDKPLRYTLGFAFKLN